MTDQPTLLEFLDRFGSEQACWQHLRTLRWGDGFECPRCGETKHWGFYAERRRFQCNECQHQTSVTAGTIMQDTKLPLRKWFLATYLLATTKKSISCPDMARKLGVHVETAWTLIHRIQRAMQPDGSMVLSGEIEADETYLGGKGMLDFRPGRLCKPVVFGAMETKKGTGRLVLKRIENTGRANLNGTLLAQVAPGSRVKTDGHPSYAPLPDHDHEVQDSPHGIPGIHLVFANLKRVLKGVHVHYSRPKVAGLVSAFAHRYNHRSQPGTGLQTALALLVATNPWPYGSFIGGYNP